MKVRVRGSVTKVSDEEADSHFASRDRGSQLGAWASRQSAVLHKRESLEAAVLETAKRFEDVSVEWRRVDRDASLPLGAPANCS